VTKTLVSLGELGIMHRDIRWANVFHALDDSLCENKERSFTREWVLFDFEYAAFAPQEAFPAHTLTSENHAPEMVRKGDEENSGGITSFEAHDTAVDIWGLGFLIQHAEVDIPESHAADLLEMECHCLQDNPRDRPTAEECLERLEALKARPTSVSFETQFR
jgi:serine/threonine protein kinase